MKLNRNWGREHICGMSVSMSWGNNLPGSPGRWLQLPQGLDLALLERLALTASSTN